MMQRCFRVKDRNYKRYGARGISVCERWRDFENFLSDMGEKPHRFTIERVNNNGDYEACNCIWAQLKVNIRNRSITRFVIFRGSRKSLAEWAEILGFTYWCLKARLARGWSVDVAFTTPPMTLREIASLGGLAKARKQVTETFQ